MKSEGDRLLPVTCSAEAPWGIHARINANVCTRCGWRAREERADVMPLLVPEQLRTAA
jgi:hypothetical protein